MKVDMSPAAVTARLEMLDELWQLGAELMEANPGSRETDVRNELLRQDVGEMRGEEGGLKRLG